MDEQLDALLLETAETFIFGFRQQKIMHWKCLRTGKRNEEGSQMGGKRLPFPVCNKNISKPGSNGFFIPV